ncbi:MarR family winged helix-turn-helix transcriptional regulator [Rugosimonospora acidiphila]
MTVDPRDPTSRLEPDPAELDSVALAAHLERLLSLIRRLSPPDISLTTASTMRTLERDGPSRLSDLAVREGVTQPAMTQLVTRLARDGYAERRGDPADARVVRVWLTERGSAVLRHRRAERARRLAELLAQLPAGDVESITAAIPALDRLVDLGQTSPTSGEVR